MFGYKNIKTIKNFFIPKGAVYAKIRKKVGDEEQIYHLVGLHLFVSTVVTNLIFPILYLNHYGQFSRW